MISRAIKVGTKLAVQDHAYLEQLAERHKTTIGAIVQVAVKRLLHDVSVRNVRLIFPEDARLKTAPNGRWSGRADRKRARA